MPSRLVAAGFARFLFPGSHPYLRVLCAIKTCLQNQEAHMETQSTRIILNCVGNIRETSSVALSWEFAVLVAPQRRAEKSYVVGRT